tara:strand:- start:154 stop:384 length:231 start_codon:yes stop_codon:yes gene_type:complete
MSKVEKVLKKNDFVHCSVQGNLIKVVCHKKTQEEKVINNLTAPGNVVFEGYEPWEDETSILTFRVLSFEEIKPVQN